MIIRQGIAADYPQLLDIWLLTPAELAPEHAKGLLTRPR